MDSLASGMPHPVVTSWTGCSARWRREVDCGPQKEEGKGCSGKQASQENDSLSVSFVPATTPSEVAFVSEAGTRERPYTSTFQLCSVGVVRHISAPQEEEMEADGDEELPDAISAVGFSWHHRFSSQQHIRRVAGFVYVCVCVRVCVCV